MCGAACCWRAGERPPPKEKVPSAPAPDHNVAVAVDDIPPTDEVEELCHAMLEAAFLTLAWAKARPRKRKRE